MPPPVGEIEVAVVAVAVVQVQAVAEVVALLVVVVAAGTRDCDVPSTTPPPLMMGGRVMGPEEKRLSKDTMPLERKRAGRGDSVAGGSGGGPDEGSHCCCCGGGGGDAICTEETLMPLLLLLLSLARVGRAESVATRGESRFPPWIPLLPSPPYIILWEADVDENCEFEACAGETGEEEDGSRGSAGEDADAEA